MHQVLNTLILEPGTKPATTDFNTLSLNGESYHCQQEESYSGKNPKRSQNCCTNKEKCTRESAYQGEEPR